MQASQRILDILLWFQTYRIPLTADIEKAFLMISISEEDRNLPRFLWFDDVSADEPNTIKLQFSRAVFGISSSPFLLNATVKYHLQKFVATHPGTVMAVSNSIYVDDIVFGAEDEETTYNLYLESKKILKEG